MKAIVLGAAGVLIPVVAPAAAEPGVWRMAESGVLGTEANFVVTAHDEDAAHAAIFAARAEIERLDDVFNSRRDGSELVALNGASGATAVSSDLFEVLARAQDWRARSDNAFHPALGAVLDLWRRAEESPPADTDLTEAAEASAQDIRLDPATRTVHRPEGARFALDGVAKGYIVDRAVEAGLQTGIRGMLVDIGGEMRCSGLGPERGGWTVGLPDPQLPYLNAPLVAEVRLKDKAIATSGRGVRDYDIGGRRWSATFDPATGQPTVGNISATVVADSAIDADALATALLVMPADKGLQLAERTPGAEARITSSGGLVHATSGWSALASEPARLVRVADPQPASVGPKWMADWAVQVIYQAPNRQDDRSPDFRSPYMAMWITDKQGKPIRTMLLIGTDSKWQKDNYVWWNLYKSGGLGEKLIELRASATALSGRYPLYWPGYDDNWKFVQQGEYVLHVETSQEHGKHTYRTMPLKLGPSGYITQMPPTKEGGGMKITYGKRED